MEQYRQQNYNALPYPKGPLRLILRAPLQLYRLGLGWILVSTPLLILTTRGRKSGLPRHAVLEYRRHGSKIYLVSAWGDMPQWYKNLLANPCVTIQRGSHEEKARAAPVTNAAEALRALHMFRRNRPLYDRLFARMSSAESIDLRTLTDVADEFTVVRLDLEKGPPELPGVRPLRPWIGSAIIGTLGALMWLVIFRAIFGKKQRDG